MRYWKDGFKTRAEAKTYLKQVRADGFVAKIKVEKDYGEFNENLPFVVYTYDFREPKHALSESYERLQKLHGGTVHTGVF
jgi:hypothetical protein